MRATLIARTLRKAYDHARDFIRGNSGQFLPEKGKIGLILSLNESKRGLSGCFQSFFQEFGVRKGVS